MWNRRSKISRVIWEDPDKTLMRVHFKNLPDVVLESIHSKSWLAEKVRKEFSKEDIDTETDDYSKYLGQKTLLFKEFESTYLDWKGWKEWRESQAKDPITGGIDVFEISKNKEHFFKIKLQVFENDVIKSSKDRKFKASLRKSQTLTELLGLLYQEGIDLENEQVSPPDEIPLQDVTNLENSED